MPLAHRIQQQPSGLDNDSRTDQLTCWLQTIFSDPIKQISPLVADASFRSYTRITTADEKSYIVMDAPTDRCDCRPFVQLANIFKQNGINVPDIFAQNNEQGFLLLSDFGQSLYLDVINKNNATLLYQKAFDQLIKIQTCDRDIGYKLPEFSQQQARDELNWFTEWYLQRHLNYELNSENEALLNTTFDLIIEQGLNQPYTCIHYDYHSRNLMLLPDDTVGIIDFQDMSELLVVE